MTKDENKGPPNRKKAWLLISLGFVAGVLLLGIGAAVLQEPYQIGPGAEIDQPDGPTIHVAETVEPTAADQNPSEGVIDLSPGARFESEGETYASVSGWHDEWLVLQNVDAQNQLTVVDGRTVSIQGEPARLEMRDYQLGESAVSVETTGETTLTLETPDSTSDYVVLVDESTGETLSGAEATDETITTTVDSDTDIRIESQDLTVSNPDPADGEAVDEAPIELSVDVEFAQEAGPTEVTFYAASDDSQIGTDTLEEAGTASVEWSELDGGPNEWYAVAEDDFGNSDELDPVTVEVPDELEVRDEEAPGELITDVDVELEFYIEGTDQSVTRTAEDGIIDMQGLPATEQFIAVASADGYQDRRIYVESIIDSQQIYLLPDDTDAVEVEFELNDFSGNYPESDSVLEIQRSIDGEWQTVQGDFFGATGQWEAILKQDTRHRLVITNVETGDQQELGAFTPQRPSTQTIDISVEGEVDVLQPIEQINFKPALSSIPASSEASITVDIREGDQALEHWDVEVVHVTDDSTTTLATESGSGEETLTFDVDLEDADGELRATVEYETENGDELATQKSWSIRENFEDGLGLLGAISGITDALGDDSAGATTMLSFLATVLITGTVAAKTRASTEVAGWTALGSLTAFWIIGWLASSVLFVAAVAFGATAAIRRGI